MDLLVLANNKAPWGNTEMMRPDLIQKMLEHVGDDMFFIDTVDKAGRWDIEVIGARYPPLMLEEQAFYACENSLRWQYGTTDEDTTYSRLEKDGEFEYVEPVASEESYPVYKVTGTDTGYAYEGCIITGKWLSVSGCGRNEYTSAFIGDAECTADDYMDKLVGLSPLSMFNPSMKLQELPVHIDKVMRPFRERFPRCYVFREGDKIDEERCEIRSLAEGELEQADATGEMFIWPSGARTVVVTYEEEWSPPLGFEGCKDPCTLLRTEINGRPAARYRRGGFDYCIQNRSTGNEFCYRR
jgi:hypothetical protein